MWFCFFFQAEDGIRDLVRSRGLGDVYKRQANDVLFIDEIHRLSTVVEEYLYAAMEDYRIDIMIDSGPNARSVQLNLNPFTLMERVSASAQIPREVEAQEERAPLIMVVDDSLTVRKITSRLLAREGYHVALAKDGVDALEQLLELVPDVVISDIEMPRMDGFDLVRNIRADKRLGNLPIIMITSRTAEKHRRHALEIGASNYLGKPYDEDELLALSAPNYATLFRDRVQATPTAMAYLAPGRASTGPDTWTPMTWAETRVKVDDLAAVV